MMRQVLSIVLLSIVFLFIVKNSQAQPGVCPELTITSSGMVSCYGDTDGTASVSATGSPGPYAYSWTNGSTSNSISNLTPGAYFVTVSDQTTGCQSFDFAVIGEPDQLSASVNSIDVACFGGTSNVDLNVIGGTLAYTFLWSNGDTNEDLTGVIAGTYTVTVTDANGCTTSVSAIVQQPVSALGATISSINPSCFGANDGSVLLDVFGGTPPYFFNWNSGAYNTEDIFNLGGGIYTVIISDNNSCTLTLSDTLADPGAITTSHVVTDVLCYGGSDGSIDLTVTGGTGTITYDWVNSTFDLSFSSEDISNIPADTYMVYITDGVGCTAVDTAIVNQPAAPVSMSFVITDVSCYGLFDGAIDLTPADGTPPYTYFWSTLVVSQDLSGLPAGTFTVTVTDNNGCVYVDSAEVSQPDQALTISGTAKNISCYNGSDGAIDVTTTGGTTPYTFNWNTGTYNTEDIDSLIIGSYNLSVTDTNGCTETANYTLSQPTDYSVTHTINDVDCFGNNNGAINLTVSGATPPYTYNWDNSTYILNLTTEDIDSLTAEEYYVTITDTNNCEYRDTIVVGEPPLIEVSAIVPAVLCYGDSNSGLLDVTVIGGTPSYTYLWNNGETTQDLSNISSGTYTQTVTDANGCVDVSTYTITEPPVALFSDAHIVGTSCIGTDDGLIIYLPFGGTPPYNISWPNGDSTSIVSGLLSGNYIVTVTDVNNCELLDTLYVPQPDSLVITDTVIPVNCYAGSSGIIDLTIQGGTTPYSYAWSNSKYQLNPTTQDLINVPVEEYSVIVTDSNNCTATGTYSVIQPDSIEVSTVIDSVICADDSTGALSISLTGGNGLFTVLWSNGETTFEIEDLPSDGYSYVATDEKGCIATDTIILNNPDSISLSAEVKPATCNDVADGVIKLMVKGGHGDNIISWQDGRTGSPLENALAITYTATVTDIVGCIADTQIVVPALSNECLEIPNAFTPNGDGTNDTWLFENSEVYANLVAKIYNNWGNLIYESKGFYKPWDGTYRGKNLPSGTYYYIIDVGNNESEPKSGSVTIVR